MLILMLLVSIGDIFYSSVVPAFITGAVASTLSVTTYFSTLGQIPVLIRDKDPRYINFPMCIAGLINGLIWFWYAILVNDIPFFTSQGIAIVILTINMIFYLWSVDLI